MGVREFPLLIHNLKDDDTIKQMQLEIGASGAAQSENALDQIIEQVITDGIRLSMSQEPALSINSIGSAAIVPSPGPASSDPSLGPPSPLPDSRSSAWSPAMVDTSSSDDSGSDCTLPEPG